MNKEFKKWRFSLPSPSADTKELILELATLLLALALTPVRFFFGTYPFGIVLCCACKRRTPFAVAGASIGALLFIDGFVPYLIALLSVIAIRLVGSVWLSDNGSKRIRLGEASRPAFMDTLFTERASVRVAICALCALGLGIYRVALGGFTYYDIFVTAFSVVFASILCYALSSADEAEPSSKAIYACALLFMVVFALRGRELFSLDVSMVISYCAILYASWRIKGTHSVALGALLGICHGVSFAPVFALGALVSSVLWQFSHALSLVGSLVLGIGYGILTSGYEAIVYLLPELLLASIIMYPLNRFDLLPTIALGKATGTGAVISHRTGELKESLGGISSSFKEISAMLSDLGARARTPDREFYKDLCLEICERHCFSCPKRSICWERDTITTKDNIAKMAESAFSEKTVSTDAVNEKFLHRCPNIEKITDEINEAKRSIESSGLKSDKLEVSAQDYELISRLIDQLSAELDEASAPNPSATEKARIACDEIGLRYLELEVLGSSSIKIIVSGIDTEGSKCSLDEVRASLEDALGCALCTPSLTEHSGSRLLTLESARSIDIEFFKSSSALNAGEESGDTLCAFFGADERFYMLLCDGMGSGRDASVTSSLCAEFMQKILATCKNKELCLTMLNNLIRAKSLECSSSIDLLEIDLISERACLTKSGAAPSFVKRGSSVFRLHSKTAPIGIMRKLDAEVLDFNLREGDIVIMVSDGIASDERDSKYLVDYLSRLEIVEDDEIIDTPPQKASQTQILSPANSALGSKISTASSAPARDTTARVSLSALPDAIISLARGRLSAKGDDMSVGVARVKAGVGNEE